MTKADAMQGFTPLRALSLVLLLPLLLAGCATGAPSAGGTDAPGTTSTSTTPPGTGEPTSEGIAGIEGSWRLISARDAAGDIDLMGSRTTLLLTDDDSSGGRTPCNNYSLSLSGGPGAITVSEIGQTEAACADPALMEVETRYLAALALVTTATRGELDPGKLQLDSEAEGIALNFEAIADPALATLIGTVWRLESLVVGTGENASVSPARGGELVFGKDGKITGNGGCRDFSGSYRSSGDEITADISEIAEADCSIGVGPQEEQVFNVLSGGFTTEIEEDRLTVTSTGSDSGLIYRAKKS